ncbi:MAG: phosphatidate cytidylyltransferase [Vicinamibacterales bacterium]
MTRVVSGGVLLLIAVGAVWFSPSWLFLIIAELLLVIGCWELSTLARHSRLQMPAAASTVAAALVCASFSEALPGGQRLPLDVVLLTALVALAALSLVSWRGGDDALGSAAAALLPSLYLGLPLGAMVATREAGGPRALFLLMLTVVVSDSAQYYTGRALGRRPLAERVSPKKTMEGAAGGLVIGSAFLAALGAWWLPSVPLPLRALLGITIVALGIVGDLFESMLKRSAGVKDSSSLIPGHGGVLDRIDALLFAAPIYYVVLRYV